MVRKGLFPAPPLSGVGLEGDSAGLLLFMSWGRDSPHPVLAAWLCQGRGRTGSSVAFALSWPSLASRALATLAR